MLKDVILAGLISGPQILGDALAPTRIIAPPRLESTRSRGKGKGAGRAYPGYWGKRISTVSRHKRDPNSPVLAAAIAKRERRAWKANRDAERSYVNNHAHSSPQLVPFYVNREV